ncbi:MAG: PDZ domain-containing protein [Synergistaceae bacterium]|nr:type II secretion system protein GspC [Synergistota bacterium]NLM71068.1 PDZ domain-containing protein [Synergistaceae bacterium]
MSGIFGSAVLQPFSRIYSRLKSERAFLFCLRTGAVILFSGIMGYWAAATLGEFLVREEIRGAKALLTAPHLTSGKSDGIGSGALTLKDFVEGDPFLARGLSDFEDDSLEITAGELYDLEGIRLTGTIPGISVWIQEDGKPQMIVLKGHSIKGYDLAEVEEDSIILQKGQATLTVLLRYSGKPSGAKTAPSLGARSTPSKAVAAARPGQQGAISRELVNQLLMDPLEEMKKFRLRPKFNGETAQGVEVQWLDENSILTSLGVKPGDVVQSVNGVEIRNMGDVVNVVNSLMSGSTFDVQVVRGGKPEMLNYNIK